MVKTASFDINSGIIYNGIMLPPRVDMMRMIMIEISSDCLWLVLIEAINIPKLLQAKAVANITSNMPGMFSPMFNPNTSQAKMNMIASCITEMKML